MDMARRLATVLIGLSLCACQVLQGLGGARGAPRATIGLPTALPSATSVPTRLPLEPTLTVQPDIDTPQVQGLRPEYAADLLLSRDWTRYSLEVNVALDSRMEQATIDGRARIRFTNPLATPLRDIELMLWPNDPQYRAEMRAGPALVNGTFVDPVPLMCDLALSLPLAKPLAPGATADISLPFHIETSGPIGGGGAPRFGVPQGGLGAPAFHSLPAPPLPRGGPVRPATSRR